MAEVSDFRYLVVPHTHWDREWYLPFEQFRLRLGSRRGFLSCSDRRHFGQQLL